MPLRETAPTGAPCWIDLFSSDTDAARAFYGELFGWKSESAGDEYGGYINFTREDVPVAGCMHNDGSQGTPDGWTIYLASDDIQATVDAAAANGGQVFVPPMDVMELGKMSVLADVGGAAVGVWQPGLHKGFGVLAEIGSPAWFELLTRDHAGSVKFYEDVFGWDTDSKGDTDEFRYTTLGRRRRPARRDHGRHDLPASGSAGLLVGVLPGREHRGRPGQDRRARRSHRHGS